MIIFRVACPTPHRHPLPSSARPSTKSTRLGAKLVEFAGWEMPVQYTGIVDEHQAVRERAGLFDVSHMGELDVHGRGAGRPSAGA